MALVLDDEQFKAVFDAFPDHPDLIAEACRRALFSIHPPIPRGTTQSGIRVYVDLGSMGSGYTMVHWDDAKQLDWCLDNGYTPHGFPEEELPLIWEENPERERLLDIQRTLRERAYG